MMYEFTINGSPISFVAESDKVAWFACLKIAEGQSVCTRQDEVIIDSQTWFMNEERRKEVCERYGCTDPETFESEHRDAIIRALKSFLPGTVNERRLYEVGLSIATNSKQRGKMLELFEEIRPIANNQYLIWAREYAANLSR